MTGMAEVLDAAGVTEGLGTLDEAWSGDPTGIRRQAELPSFLSAIAVVDQVAAVAEELDHHPDIDIRWRTLTFALATHSAGGVTAKDFALATRIDEIVRATTN